MYIICNTSSSLVCIRISSRHSYYTRVLHISVGIGKLGFWYVGRSNLIYGAKLAPWQSHSYRTVRALARITLSSRCPETTVASSPINIRSVFGSATNNIDVLYTHIQQTHSRGLLQAAVVLTTIALHPICIISTFSSTLTPQWRRHVNNKNNITHR